MARSFFIPVCLIFIVANEVNFLSAMPALAPESEAPLSRNVRAVSLPQGVECVPEYECTNVYGSNPDHITTYGSISSIDANCSSDSGLILCVADESIDNNISLDESLVPLGSPPTSGSCNSPIEPTFINGRRYFSFCELMLLLGGL